MSARFASPLKKWVVPELERQGFRRVRTGPEWLFGRVRGDLFQAFLAGAVGKDDLFARFATNTLVLHRTRFVVEPGGVVGHLDGGKVAAVFGPAAAAARPLSHRTSKDVFRDVEALARELAGPVADFWKRTATLDGYVAELPELSFQTEAAGQLELACCQARLDRAPEAKAAATRAAQLLAEVMKAGATTDEVLEAHNQATALVHALTEGSSHQLLSAWKAETIRALGLEELAPRT